jgi:hypothetical protein
VLTERLPDDHGWLRVADPAWTDPLDPSFAATTGGRWNPPDSFPVLYLNEDVVTARINLQLFLAGLPYGPEDLRDDTGPVLVEAVLPRRQEVADVHSQAGVAAAGLPPTYPQDASGALVDHARCQPIGLAAHGAGLRGVRSRSARAPYGAGRELAWFPASVRSRARAVSVQPFTAWFWA